MSRTPGRLIIINGASSAGKSTLAAAAQAALPAPFLWLSPDAILFGDALPRAADGTVRDWAEIRPLVFDGYFGSLRSFTDAGVNVITDFIVEDVDSLERLEQAIDGVDTFWVGLHVDVPELEQRERERGDRTVGDARRDAETVHTFRSYDLNLDGADPLESNVTALVSAWEGR